MFSHLSAPATADDRGVQRPYSSLIAKWALIAIWNVTTNTHERCNNNGNNPSGNIFDKLHFSNLQHEIGFFVYKMYLLVLLFVLPVTPAVVNHNFTLANKVEANANCTVALRTTCGTLVLESQPNNPETLVFTKRARQTKLCREFARDLIWSSVKLACRAPNRVNNAHRSSLWPSG